MWKQSLAAVAALGMLVATSHAQVVVEVEAEVDKAADAKGDKPAEVRAYAVQLDDSGATAAFQLRDLAVPFWVGGDMGKYYVGVQCHPASATLRAQLELDKNAGLVVAHVAKDGPAAKAGIEQHDVLLTIGDANVANQRQLSEQIEKSEGKAIKFKLMRAGKEKAIEVTPAERKKVAAPKTEALPTEEAVKKALEWIKKHQAEGPGGAPLKLRMLGPGVVVGGDVRLGGGDIPKGLSVSVTRTVGEPAKITVKQGDKTWEIKEGKLDKLPKDLRPHVMRLMGGPGMPLDVRKLKAKPFDVDLDFHVEKLDPARVRTKVLRRHVEIDGDVKKQIREMNERLEKMRKELRELLEKQAKE